MIGMGVSVFLEMLKKASVSKTVSSPLIENIMFRMEDEGLKTCMLPDSEVLIEYYFIPKQRFDVYKPDTDEFAFNVPDLFKAVKEMFNGRINLKINTETNKLIVEDTEKRSIDIDLLDPTVVKQADEEALEITENYVVPKDDHVVFHGRILQDKLKPLTKLTKKSEEETIKFTFKGNVVFLDYKKGLVNIHDKMIAETTVSEMEISGTYPAYLLKLILSVLSGDITVTVTESGVMSIGKVTDAERIHYIFAPVEE